MGLSAGSSVGPYEILEAIGAGGMGEVYRGRDAKLRRDVAIKVLPEQFTIDPDRLARFHREAQVLASLNHQNIGHIYGFEDSHGVHALILEFIDGPTLADRIAQGPMLLEEALPIARQVADALECAHDQGIVHRDLKPANVKVRPDGTVKVLDFGLAKALDPVGASSDNTMNSPTLTARATQLGMIIGTAAYMAPEQARGKATDRRADVWAFGVVLFEMLSGRRAFEGDDISITLASVLKDDLDWRALPADTPPGVIRVLRRCLEKDPKRRMSAIGDARFELEEAVAAGPRRPDAAAPMKAIHRVWRALPWSIAAAGVALAVTAVALWRPWRHPSAPPPIRVSAELGAAAALTVMSGPALTLSRDGRKMAFVANTGGRSQLYVRHLWDLQGTPLAGTDGAAAPFFSPDGQWIAFFADAKLKKIAFSGGAAMALCDAPGGRGGTWSEDGRIIFQPSAGQKAVLHQVSDGGGDAAPFGALEPGESTQRWPQLLPRGDLLYTATNASLGWDAAYVVVRPRDGGSAKIVVRGGYFGRYVPTGHLLYLNRAVLYAVPLDVERLTTGNPVPMVDGVLGAPANGAAHFSVSDSGTLTYVPGRSMGLEAPVHVVGIDGRATVLREQPAEWSSPRFSPDGSKLALTIKSNPQSDIWIHEPGRDLTKLTFGRGGDFAPAWTPDGERIAFASAPEQGGMADLYWVRSNGTGQPQRLTNTNTAHVPGSFHPLERLLAFQERSSAGDFDIRILRIEGDEKSGWKPGAITTFLNEPHVEASPMFSPDGKWLAYVSLETGSSEVYVRSFPAGDSKWKISTNGGVYPAWSRSGLMYMEPGALWTPMVASYRVERNAFVAQAPVRWGTAQVQPRGLERLYDPHPDGRRIAFLKPPDDVTTAARGTLVFVFNFFDELRRAAGEAATR